MSIKTRAGASNRTVTAAVRNATANRLLQATKQRSTAIAAADAALNRAYIAINDPNSCFQRSGLREVYASLRVLRRSAARVRIAASRDIYAAVTHGVPNTRIASQFEDLSLAHAKTAMLMIATRASLAAEGDTSITAAELIAIDDNGVVADCAEDNLSTASGKRASRFTAASSLSTAADEGDDTDECASLQASADDLDEAVASATADITTPGDDVSDVTLPGSKANRKADITTPGDAAADKVRTTQRDPNTPLDTPATAGKKKAEGDSTDGGGFPLSERDAARANQARRKQADANDDLPAEPGTTDQNVDTHFSGNPNDPEAGEPNPSNGDASKGERPKFDAKSNRNRRADANDDLPAEPGTTDQNVDTHFAGDPNDPEAGEPNPSDGDASKGERPKFDAKSNRKRRADAWEQDEGEPQDRASASAGDDDSKPAAPKAPPAAPKAPPAAPKAPAAPAAPAPKAPPAPAPAAPAPQPQAPGMDDLMGGAPMVDPMMDPSMLMGLGEPGDMDGTQFGMPDQNGMDAILAQEILGQDSFPGSDAGDDSDLSSDPALVPTGQEVAGAAPFPGAMSADKRAARLASATSSSDRAAANADSMLRTMINHDLLS